MQFFGNEVFTQLEIVSGTQLKYNAGSVLKLGGRGFNLSEDKILNLSDIDTGAVEPETLYYVYAVVSGSEVQLRYSKNESPSGFTRFSLIGGFLTDDNSEIERVQSSSRFKIVKNLASIISQARYVELVGDDINWRQGEIFERSILDNVTLTFSNLPPAKTIIVAVKNTTGALHNVNFPSSVLWPDGSPIVEVAANTTSIFTFVKVASDIYATSVQEMS